jgi:hypothetical protein
MKDSVRQAIVELQASFSDATITAREDGEGGAFVTVDPVPLGAQYSQDATWIAFHIGFQYPYSDVYPLFVRPDLARKDTAALGDGFACAAFDNRPATQLSRRTKQLDPAVQTATTKLLKVLEWLNTR